MWPIYRHCGSTPQGPHPTTCGFEEVEWSQRRGDQLAKHLGATVATTASGANADFVRELGADIVIDYRSQDFEQLLTGYDLVLDSLGGENLEKSLRVLSPAARPSGSPGHRTRPSPTAQD